MRGGVQLTIAATVLVLVVCCTSSLHGLRCDLSPDGVSTPKTMADGRFQLTISGDIERYNPDVSYTVSIQGMRDGPSSNVPKFIGFKLIAEAQVPMWMSFSEIENRPVGVFSLYGDALTKFSDSCPNMVTQTSFTSKTEISVIWKAPPSGSGCLTIRATVIEHRDTWYQDERLLSRTLCENVEDSFDSAPPFIRECCSCNEAKYEVTFEGLWSRHTHPKDFPTNSWLTRFSDVIGASHTSNYSFWEYGGLASGGLRQVALNGATKQLEAELKQESQNIRTIIKARGISYPNVTGKTFAVFRVDKKHHLISLVSMIDPSPDWVVGVSKLELCLENCSWVENKVLNLYPWDTGIDSGITYTSPTQPTVPQEPIRRINSSYPADHKSPFFDPSGEEMKPMAKLYLNRQRIYERSCTDSEELSEPDDACEVLRQWSDWGICIPTESCGIGFQTRQREYKEPEKAGSLLCSEQVTQRKNCTIPNANCGPDIRYLSRVLPECEQAEWSDWSTCSATCGRGNKVRQKIFKDEFEKECRFNVEFQETRECDEPLDDCSQTYPEGSLADSDKCPWSHWSPCMASCNKGKQIRTRFALPHYVADDPCTGLVMTEEVECDTGRSCDISTEQAYEYSTPPGIPSRSQIKATSESPDSDNQDVQEGEQCEYSKWGKWSQCSKKCGRGERERFRTVKVKPKTGESCPEIQQKKKCRGKQCGNPELCKYSNWSVWSPCSATCGHGATRQRTRHVIPVKHFNTDVCIDRVEKQQCIVLPCF
ncbi:spondin-1 isoform X2 [Nilaparvata lugens]|uniref:spondin-1 isoform X2 n=1 Tax=Nilaparvata lugens TaxID=108931 RepID=UPI00193E2CD7|nr:spondin-1 isoform X2 [Nilaparvata lugens]